MGSIEEWWLSKGSGREGRGQAGVKHIKILPDLRPGGSERLLLREAGIGALCLILIAVTCTGELMGFGRRGEAGTRGGEAEAGKETLEVVAGASSLPPPLPGEICGFRLHGSGVPFEAVILDKATGEGLIRAKEPVDCEAQKEHTFTIQAYDCGEGPDGANTKKSHK